MKFLTRVSIQDFRSIASAELEGLQDVTPIVGLNGSGKSNFLRALNAFFNGEIERGEPFALRRDFRALKGKKFQVVVEVDLDYSVFEKLRKAYTDALDAVAGGELQLTVRREWMLDAAGEEISRLYAGPSTSALAPLEDEDLQYATRLLRAVRFRYIPNHVHPSQVLLEEQDAIRRILFDRLSQQGVISSSVVGDIAAAARELMRPIEDSMSLTTDSIGEVALATPEDWRELAWSFGLAMRTSSQLRPMEAVLHGSGIQSLLAYEVLHFLDTTVERGWHKGALWAVEEPESFLHARLQAELARLFSTYAAEDPLQILMTTHNAAFVGVTPAGVHVEMDETGRSVLDILPRSDIIRAAYTEGTTAWSHPLHTGPPKPMLLVEGEDDRDLLLLAYELGRVVNPYEILCLKDFDPSMTGGSQLAEWLRYHRDALEARPSTSPIFVLVDWEMPVADKPGFKKLNDAVAVHDTSRCIAWPEDLANPDLGPTWFGIERYVGTTLIEHLIANFGLKVTSPIPPSSETWRFAVSRQQLKIVKPRLHAELHDRRSSRDVEHLIAGLEWINSQLTDVPPML